AAEGVGAGMGRVVLDQEEALGRVLALGGGGAADDPGCARGGGGGEAEEGARRRGEAEEAAGDLGLLAGTGSGCKVCIRRGGAGWGGPPRHGGPECRRADVVLTS